MPEHAMEQTAAAVKRPMRNPGPAPHAHVHASAPVWDARAPVPGAPSAVLGIQRAAGNLAVMRMLDVRRPGHPLAGPSTAIQTLRDDELDDDVQRAAAALHEPSDEAIRSAAAEGVRTPSTTLPHLDRIQASFGRHSIAHIQAHVGPEAARASRAMNALAYASGNHVVFGATPDLRTAAHEAAHIVQQQAGVQLSGGIGRPGDPYERHADAVADAVVAGRPAEGLLEALDSSQSLPLRGVLNLQPTIDNRLWAGAAYPSPIQRIIEIEYDYRGKLNSWFLDKYQAANLLVNEYKLVGTGKLIRKLAEFDERNVIFSDIEELVKVLRDQDVPAVSVADQAYDVLLGKERSRSSNFANAYVVISPGPTKLFETQQSGNIGTSTYVYTDTEKAARKEDEKRSQQDSEVGLLQSIHAYLLDRNRTNLTDKKPSVYIRIVSNMGPCDACKERINYFRKKFAELVGYGNEKLTGGGENKLVIDVYYASTPRDAGYRDSRYGWTEDKKTTTGVRNDDLYKDETAGLYRDRMYVHKSA